MSTNAARASFDALAPDEQAEAVRRLATEYGPRTAAQASSLSVEQVRRLIADETQPEESR